MDPSPPGFVKINCDAAWSDPSSPCGIGVVIRDHQYTVKGGSARSICCNSTYPLIEEIRRKSLQFSEIYWDWIPREANTVAHTAASLAKGTVGLNRWANTPPPSLLRVLKIDGLPCPPRQSS
ncbi:putative ribonuclease H-like domain-containing protein [Rosa chinensis]|uniref:Putative ribonuclease H-like domain-containing protein n=1 Tax=Rosa chinensis TaxID=74649 RepID=A0A2P6QVY7_ROSCH|nr:putative ribonuclease H-like domain-containing protein [Rosa chinensis]